MFNVGAGKLSVLIPRGRMSVRGEECFGLCDEQGRRILISPAAPLDRRLWILGHELAHAHILSTGQPVDTEGLCDLFATMFSAGIRDLTNAGGEEALKRLSPGESLGKATGKVGLTSNRYCAVCGATVAPGRIQVTSTGDGHVELRVPCRHCDALSCWREMATHGGLPSGVVIGEPRVLRGCDDDEPVAAGELRYVDND